jgi:uncharacterized membrane protein YdjX (TVP38/TMEM64 family)
MSAHSSRTSIAAPDQDRKEIWRLLVKPLGLLLGLVLAGVVIKTLSGGLNNGLLAQYVVGHGIEGEAFFVAGGALLCAVGLPRQAVAFAGGYAFGLKLGFVLAMTAQILGCVVDFFWARAIARDWVRGRLGARLARLDSQLSAQPFMASLTLRLLPVGNNVVLSLLAGISSVGAVPFLAASFIGYVPQTLVFGLLGSGVHVSHSTQIVLGSVLFVLSALLGVVLLRRWRKQTSVAA